MSNKSQNVSNFTNKPAWVADHYSAEVEFFVLHVHRWVRRRKNQTLELPAKGSFVPYEYYSWRVVSSTSERHEAGRGVATTKDLAEAACLAVVQAAQGLPNAAFPKYADQNQYEDE